MKPGAEEGGISMKEDLAVNGHQRIQTNHAVMGMCSYHGAMS